MLSPSPPRHSPPVPHKSKKELWKDLKIQSKLAGIWSGPQLIIGIAKSLTTAYLVPLLLILTSSQLSTLARAKYLNDIKTSLPGPHRRDVLDEDDAPAPKKQEPKSGWLNYFSVEAMGLAEYAEPSTSSSPLNFVSRLVPAFLQPAAQNASLEIFDQDEEEDRAEAERLFLTYSWWLLHEGWQGVADRVDDAVERVFAK
jgi:peroxin-3